MPADRALADVSEDAILGGRLTLRQPLRGHRFGHDAILLAAAVSAHAGEHAIELGAGVGAAGLALAHRVGGLSVTLVEIDRALASLAKSNAERNGVADRVRVLCLDAEVLGRRVCGGRSRARLRRAHTDESAVQCRAA